MKVTTSNTKTPLENQKRELKEHIEAIIDDNLGLIDYKDDITEQLCNAIDIHLPSLD